MTTDQPTILATSGGYRPGHRTRFEFDALVHHAVELSGAHGRRPRVTVLGTAAGDPEAFSLRALEAGRVAGFETSVLSLFPMPNLADVAGHLLDQDVVWVNGGSVANLLAVWDVHDLRPAFRAAWEAGVVLAGVSAGSICWYLGGTTDSFGPELRAVTNGLALFPTATACTTTRRSGAARSCTGSSPTARCPRPTAPTTASASSTAAPSSSRRSPSRTAKGAYVVTREGDGVREERLEPRRLPPP